MERESRTELKVWYACRVTYEQREQYERDGCRFVAGWYCLGGVRWAWYERDA